MSEAIYTTNMGKIAIHPSVKKYRRNFGMKYSIGDVVKFRLDSGEIHKGNIRFIEGRDDEDILYINSFNRWAYKVPEKRIIAKIQG